MNNNKIIKALKYIKIFFKELNEMIEENYPLSSDYDYEMNNREYDDFKKTFRK